MIKDLIARRVPHILGLYLAAGWGMLEFTDYVTNRYLLSPHLVDLALLLWALMTPTVCVLAYFHGRPGRDEWTRVEKITIPINVLVAAVILFVTFRGQELGATTRQVTVEDETGQTLERTVPKSEFRQRLALYYLVNESSDSTLDWLRRGIPIAVEQDLSQDLFIDARTAWPYFHERLKEEGYPDGIDLPLALRRDIADDLHLEYFASGSVNRADDGGLLVTVSLHDVERGRLIQEQSFQGDNIFDLVDEISVQLKRDLKIPEQRIEQARDLPYAELATRSIPAFRDYIGARLAIEGSEDWQTAADRLAEAVERDPTYVQASGLLFQAYLLLNETAKAHAALESAMQHAFKLPERAQFSMKTAYYLLVKQDVEKAKTVAGMHAELFPDDIAAHRMQLQLYSNAGDRERAIAAATRILELDPDELDILREISNLYREKGDFQRAIEYLQRYVEEAPTDPRGFIQLGDIGRRQGDLDAARRYYERALVLEPDNITALLNIADLEVRLGRHEQAEASFDDAMAAVSTPTQRQQLYGALSSYHQRRGEMTEALEFMHLQWRELDVAFPPAQALISKMTGLDTYVLAGFADSARMTIAVVEEQLAPPLDKLVALGRLALADELEDAEALEEALADVDELIETLGFEALRPTVILHRGRLQEIRGNCEEALRAYERSLELLPSNAEINGLSGRCQRKLGRYDAALGRFEKVLEIDPSNPKAHLEISRTLKAQDRLAEARQHLESALEVWAEADPSFELAREARAELEALETRL